MVVVAHIDHLVPDAVVIPRIFLVEEGIRIISSSHLKHPTVHIDSIDYWILLPTKTTGEFRVLQLRGVLVVVVVGVLVLVYYQPPALQLLL